MGTSRQPSPPLVGDWVCVCGGAVQRAWEMGEQGADDAQRHCAECWRFGRYAGAVEHTGAYCAPSFACQDDFVIPLLGRTTHPLQSMYITPLVFAVLTI